MEPHTQQILSKPNTNKNSVQNRKMFRLDGYTINGNSNSGIKCDIWIRQFGVGGRVISRV